MWNPRSIKHEWNLWATQDPCQPKIPVSPRSQSSQDPSQPKIPIRDALMPFWFIPIWYLAHAYLVFDSCYCIWLMWNLHQLNFSSMYYIPTWISVMCIWHIHIFPNLKKGMSQGPPVFSISNFFQFHYCLYSRYTLINII